MKKPIPKKHKYSARKVFVDGHKFDSKKEANRYMVLRNMLNVGLIRNLELQPEFLLQEGFRHKGKKYREIKYIADFRYIDDEGVEWVEDTKGYKTEGYQIKKKLFLKKYPEVNFRET